MKGRVTLINFQRGMAALLTDKGEYTSFELFGDEVELGDIISGDLESLGGEVWYNETQNVRFKVMVQDIYGSKKTAMEIIS